MSRGLLQPGLALLVVLTAAWIVYQGRVGGALSEFLPHGASPAQRLVTGELRHGTAGRLLLAVLHGPEPAAAAAAVPRLRERLADSNTFRLVAMRPDPALLEASGLVFEYRYLLSDRVDRELLTAPRLHTELTQLVERLRGAGPPVDERRAAADPTGEYRHVLARIFGGQEDATAGPWRTAAGWPVIVTLPRAPAFDLDAQARAIERIEQAARDLGSGFRAEVSGAPAIAVATRAHIRGEVVRITAIAAFAVAAIIVLALRSLRVLLVCALPISASMLVGTAAVILVFGQVHGITLAFAAILLGVTVDYPLHLLWHQRHTDTQRVPHSVRRPMVIGALSTGIAFAAIGIGGFPGLQQLAVLSATGILAAAALTLWVLPQLPLRPGRPGTATRYHEAPLVLRSWTVAIAIGAVLAGTVVTATNIRLDTDLSELSPIPPELRARDQAARSAAGIATPGHFVRVTGTGRQAVLERTEQAAARLAVLQRNGAVDHFSAVTALLPSTATQRQRQGYLPTAADLRTTLATATGGLPLRPRAFEPFVADVAASRDLEPLVPEALPSGFLQSWARDRLFRFEEQWTSIIELGQIDDTSATAAVLSGVPGAGLIDVTAVTSRLVTHYQHAALARFGLGCVLIVGMLAVALGDRRRVAAVVLTVAGAVAGTSVYLGLVGGPVNVFEVISLLLVAGLGLDYGLFATGPSRGRGSVTVCALSTATAFGLLASADIPVLRDIGATVALGTLLAWLLALGIVRIEGARPEE